MIREVVQINLSDDYKKKAMDIVNDKIDEIADKKNYSLDESEKREIRNLSLDQVSVNVSTRSRSKTLWVFNSEDALPIVVEKETGVPKSGVLANKTPNGCSYKMKPNLTWTYNRKNTGKGGLSHEEFEEKALEMLLEDFETSAFYGVLSYVTESDEL